MAGSMARQIGGGNCWAPSPGLPLAPDGWLQGRGAGWGAGAPAGGPKGAQVLAPQRPPPHLYFLLRQRQVVPGPPICRRDRPQGVGEWGSGRAGGLGGLQALPRSHGHSGTAAGKGGIAPQGLWRCGGRASAAGAAGGSRGLSGVPNWLQNECRGRASLLGGARPAASGPSRAHGPRRSLIAARLHASALSRCRRNSVSAPGRGTQGRRQHPPETAAERARRGGSARQHSRGSHG